MTRHATALRRRDDGLSSWDIVVLILLALVWSTCEAQAQRAFAARFRTNQYGNIVMAANTLMTTTNANAANIQAGITATHNDNLNMQFVDVDGIAGTFNSSSAALSMPPGAVVTFAGLYWGADTAAGSQQENVNGVAAPNASARNQVRFATPAAAYATITASQLDNIGTRYQGFADVTAAVRNGGNGNYMVANVQAGRGGARYAGWSLVVVYQHGSELARNLVVFDGFQNVSSGSTVTIPLSGFITPPAGSVNIALGAIAYEGDLGLLGDVLRFGQTSGTATEVGDALNPISPPAANDNTFNSSITRLGTRVTAKTPDYVNQLGFDADVISANGKLGNNVTNAVVLINSSGDVYLPGVITTAIEVYSPVVIPNLTKTVQDINGGNLEPGDILEYTLTFANTGQDNAANVVMRDTIPANTTYVPGSLRMNGTARTDAIGDDQADYVASTNTVTFRLGTGATASLGGTLAPGTAGTNIFRVRISATATNRTVITNVANVSYTAQTLGQSFTGSTPVSSSVVTNEADIVVFKSGPTNVLAGGSLTYTISMTNRGPSIATNVVVSDTLPAGVTFVGASGGGVLAGGVVTWPTLSTVTNGGRAAYTVTVTSPTAITLLTNRASSISGTADPIPANNNGTNAEAMVITATRGVNVSGFVYLDANHNLSKDAAESGTGLNLFAKIYRTATPGGPALQAVAATPATGLYTFSNVVAGVYNIILDNNTNLTDVTPAIPPGWIGTEMPTQLRTNVAVAATDVVNQNFGLANALAVSGRVFRDIGGGGGVANDGVLNGNEAGIAGAIVRLTDSTGSTVFDTATTDGNGSYALLIPAATGNSTLLKVVEMNPAGFLSVGASVGNTGGSYTRTNDTIGFSFTAGTTYTNVNFGDVPENSFVPNGAQSGLPGGFVVYAHTFTAGSGGQVTFLSSNQPNPVVAGWTQVLYRDANCNGQLDPADPVLINPIAVTAGQVLCILVRESIPLTAPFNAEDIVTVQASFDFLGASPALSSNHLVTDTTRVGNPTTAGLTLIKSADKAQARPGDAIIYTITYANTSSESLQNIVLHDSTPAYTTFFSATNGPLSTNLTGVVITSPVVGATGPVRWTFSGSLAPGRNGFVTFSVVITQ